MSYYLRTAKLIMDNFGNLSRPQQHQLNNSNASTVLRLCFIDELVGAPADTPEGGGEARTPKNTSGLSKIALREEQCEEDKAG